MVTPVDKHRRSPPFHRVVILTIGLLFALRSWKPPLFLVPGPSAVMQPPRQQAPSNSMDDSLYTIVTAKTTPSFKIAVYKSGDVVSKNAKKYGAWEGGLSNVLLAILQLKPGPHKIVDFGTHVGWFSLLAASRGHTSIGFEAMSSNRDAIMHSVHLNQFQNLVQLYPAALGSEKSPPELCIGPRTIGNVGNGQVRNVGDDCAEKVPVLTLDKIIGKQDIMFLKADCEGCEGSAIMGGRELFLQRPPCAVFIEWRSAAIREVGVDDPADVANFLLDRGYRFFSVRADLATGEKLEVTQLSREKVTYTSTAGGCDLLLMHLSDRCFAESDVTKFLNKVKQARENFDPNLIVQF